MESLSLGPFHLVEAVGEGTMGRVYRGEHRVGGTEVAVKVMTSHLARREYFRRRFRREVEAMAQLNHPSIATVFDLGEVTAETAERSEGLLPEGSPWLAMEYVEGVSLAGRTGSWGWPRVRWILLELLDALGHSHATGVIHRDLKPSNILVRHDTQHGFRLKLVDFGVARIVDPDEEGVGAEVEERIAGTPKYMAPEQILGRRRDQGPWTDLYALGCLAWRSVTGYPPFDEGETDAIFRAHLEEPLPELNSVFEVPEQFEDWLGTLLTKNPYERFQRAADAAHALLKMSSVSAGISAEFTSPADEASSVEVEADWSSEMALEETAVAEAHGELGEESSVEMTPERAGSDEWDQAPVPGTWRRPDPPELSAQIRGAGLGLFGLRRIPLVGREVERDRLWDVLRRVIRTERAEAVLMGGQTGYGKSRLLEWLARKGHESGAVSVFRAPPGPQGGARHRLGSMLARHFRCVGMEPQALVERLERLYEVLGITGATAHHDVLGVAELMASAAGLETEGTGATGFGSPEERNRALARLFEHLARRRPVLIAVEEAHRGGDVTSMVEFLVREVEAEFPLMAVMTAPKPPGAEAKPLKALMGSSRVHRLEIGPLSEDEQRTLVGQLLGLGPELAARVAERTEGNPMFAVQLVGDWVERGLLTVGPEGFAVRDDSELDVPDDIFGLWNRRVDQLLEALRLGRRARVRAALETAAALGSSIRPDEWQSVAERIGLSDPDALVDRMVRTGLAERDEEGWSFAHGMLRESLARAARESGRWSEHNALCVEVVEECRELTSVGAPVRLAWHLVEAGREREALPWLLRAIRQALESGEYKRTAKLLERRTQLMERAGLAEGARARVENWVVHGELLGAAGEPRRAQKWARRAVEMAGREGWKDVLGDALRLRATARREDSEFREALEDCKRAVACFEETGNDEGIARTQYIRARIHQMMGQTEEAEAQFVASIEWFEAAGDRSMQTLITSDIGYIWIMEGDYEQARRALKVGLHIAREVGNRKVAAKCWNRLGEIARFEQEWERARTCYRKAEELFRVPRNQHVANLNLAFVELADGNYRAAESFLMLLKRSFSPTGVHFPPVLMGLACCAAAAGDWERWEGRFDRCVASLEESGMAHADLPWLAEKAGRLARAAGEDERARRAYAFAARQWAQIGDTEAAEALVERIDTLGAEEAAVEDAES